MTKKLEGKVVKDYMDRDLDLPSQDEFVLITCSKCGDTVCYSVEDTSLNTCLCDVCMNEVFPDDT